MAWIAIGVVGSWLRAQDGLFVLFTEYARIQPVEPKYLKLKCFTDAQVGFMSFRLNKYLLHIMASFDLVRPGPVDWLTNTDVQVTHSYLSIVVSGP